MEACEAMCSRWEGGGGVGEEEGDILASVGMVVLASLSVLFLFGSGSVEGVVVGVGRAGSGRETLGCFKVAVDCGGDDVLLLEVEVGLACDCIATGTTVTSKQ